MPSINICSSFCPIILLWCVYCVCAYIYIYECVCACVCVCVCVCVPLCAFKCMYVCLIISSCIHMYLYVLCICMCYVHMTTIHSDITHSNTLQIKLLQSLGLRSTLITDGSQPLNLFTTAQGQLGAIGSGPSNTEEADWAHVYMYVH